MRADVTGMPSKWFRNNSAGLGLVSAGLGLVSAGLGLVSAGLGGPSAVLGLGSLLRASPCGIYVRVPSL